MRSLRTADDSWPVPIAAAPKDATIFLDEPVAGEDMTITLSANGAALSITCAPGLEATITIVQRGEEMLKETIKV